MEGDSDSAQLWSLTLQNSPVAMALVSPAGDLFVVNASFCQMMGYDAETLRTMNVQDITHPDDPDDDLELMRATLAGERNSYRLRKRYLCAGGRVVWGDLSVAVLRDDHGKPIHFISQILDVTAQHEFEGRIAVAHATIELQSRMVQAVYDSVDVGLLLIDRSGHYDRMNRRHEDFIGLAFPDGHLGQAGQLGFVFAPDGTTPLTREESPSYRALQGEEFDDLRVWIGREPAERRALSVSARTVHGPAGGIEGAALAYTDVTDYMRALGVKDEFVASVSHELRTPLTSVLGHLEMLADRDDLPAEASEQIKVVERNAIRLDNLVSDLLQVAQGSEGAIHLVCARCDVATLVREAVEAARPLAGRAGVHLELDSPASLVCDVDAHRLRQVLDNLISNGVKYTDAGGSVTLTLRQVGDAVEMEVADTGIGITLDDADKVFTRFFRAPAAQSRMAPGTGLGLSIVRSIVEAHGGQVGVRSDIGRGSRFSVSLPRSSG
ncbi:sensor histidine kinase [Nocardioides sp.]|uniref:sensor histidine kinase n=1 Tax=Nocardioides sp. TaxID=35761 RepID=UPI002C2C3518|nr:ATP-binding protein [Nocardioides sp.]HXH77253.1 ATP-binding protein [Nocardioides sp.]